MDAPTETASPRTRAWQVHGGLLAAWTVVAVAAAADIAGDGEHAGLALALVGVPLLAYAAVTSLMMLFVGRRPLAAVLVHVGMITVWAGCALTLMTQRSADLDEAPRSVGGR